MPHDRAAPSAGGQGAVFVIGPQTLLAYPLGWRDGRHRAVEPRARALKGAIVDLGSLDGQESAKRTLPRWAGSRHVGFPSDAAPLSAGLERRSTPRCRAQGMGFATRHRWSQQPAGIGICKIYPPQKYLGQNPNGVLCTFHCCSLKYATQRPGRLQRQTRARFEARGLGVTTQCLSSSGPQWLERYTP